MRGNFTRERVSKDVNTVLCTRARERERNLWGLVLHVYEQVGIRCAQVVAPIARIDKEMGGGGGNWLWLGLLWNEENI